MKIIWTIATNDSKILLNIDTAAFQLSCGDTVTVDRHITVIEPLKELGNNMYQMTWLDVILWRVNDTYMEDITPMPPEVSTRLVKPHTTKIVCFPSVQVIARSLFRRRELPYCRYGPDSEAHAVRP